MAIVYVQDFLSLGCSWKLQIWADGWAYVYTTRSPVYPACRGFVIRSKVCLDAFRLQFDSYERPAQLSLF